MLRLHAPLSLVLIAAALGACGDEEDPGGSSPGAADTAASPTTDQGPATSSEGCRAVEQPPPNGGAEKPKEKLEPAKRHALRVKTNCGDFTIELDVDAAPKTTASVVSLAKQGFYDGTIFHRIVPGFVIQGGDPTGTGQGGPGYSTVDRPPQDARYTKGVVAMAKTGTEPPGTSGSQFYVVTGADAGLPPEYAIIGKVSDGLDVIERIGNLGSPTEMPTEVVVIEDMTVETS